MIHLIKRRSSWITADVHQVMRVIVCDEDISYVSRSPVSESGYPQRFSAFLADRAVRKPPQHTAKAYRQDFAAIAALLAGDRAQIA